MQLTQWVFIICRLNRTSNNYEASTKTQIKKVKQSHYRSGVAQRVPRN